DKTKIFLFNRSTFSTSDAQKRASKEGSPFALPLSKILCLLLGLFTITTPLLAAEKIDYGLNIYYQLQGIYDYFDGDGQGKFSKWCEENGYEDETIIEELDEDIEDCAILEFDCKFPLPKDVGNQRAFIFYFIKKLKEFEVSNLTKQQVEQIVNNYPVKGKSDASSQIKFQKDKPRPKSSQEKKGVFGKGAYKEKLIAGYLRLGNARLYCKDLIELVFKYWVLSPPTKIVGKFIIAEKDLQPISEQDFCDQSDEVQWDQYAFSFKRFGEIYRLALPASRNDIIKYKNSYKYENNHISRSAIDGFTRLLYKGACKGLVIFDIEEKEKREMCKNHRYFLQDFADFSKEVFKEIGEMAKYAIRYEDKTFLCLPVFILRWNTTDKNLKLQTLNIWTLYYYSNNIFNFQDRRKGSTIKDRVKRLSDSIKHDPYMPKYLQVQWLLNARDGLHHLAKNVLKGARRSDKSLECFTVLRAMVDLLMNDRLDAKVLMEKLKQMKNDYNSQSQGWGAKKKCNLVEACLDEAIEAKCLDW
ncbi:MAG: hypothetical protein AAF335_02585, partial [Bacteroidota bacterium]